MKDLISHRGRSLKSQISIPKLPSLQKSQREALPNKQNFHSQRHHEDIKVLSPFYEKIHNEKGPCFCPYHRMKRYKQRAILRKHNKNGPFNMDFCQYEDRIANAVIESCNYESREKEDYGRFRRWNTQNSEYNQIKSIKQILDKANTSANLLEKDPLKQYTALFEEIIKKRLQPMSDEDQINGVLKFLQMKTKLDINYLSKTRDHIKNNLLKISKKIGFAQILKAEKQNISLIKKTNIILDCDDQFAWQFISSIQKCHNDFQNFIISKTQAKFVQNEAIIRTTQKSKADEKSITNDVSMFSVHNSDKRFGIEEYIQKISKKGQKNNNQDTEDNEDLDNNSLDISNNKNQKQKRAQRKNSNASIYNNNKNGGASSSKRNINSTKNTNGNIDTMKKIQRENRKAQRYQYGNKTKNGSGIQIQQLRQNQQYYDDDMIIAKAAKRTIKKKSSIFSSANSNIGEDDGQSDSYQESADNISSSCLDNQQDFQLNNQTQNGESKAFIKKRKGKTQACDEILTENEGGDPTQVKVSRKKPIMSQIRKPTRRRTIVHNLQQGILLPDQEIIVEESGIDSKTDVNQMNIPTQKTIISHKSKKRISIRKRTSRKSKEITKNIKKPQKITLSKQNQIHKSSKGVKPGSGKNKKIKKSAISADPFDRIDYKKIMTWEQFLNVKIVLNVMRTITDQDRMDNLIDVIKGNIDNNSEFFQNFLQKFSPVITEKQKEILRKAYSQYMFERMIASFIKEVDYCLYEIKHADDLVWKDDEIYVPYCRFQKPVNMDLGDFKIGLLKQFGSYVANYYVPEKKKQKRTMATEGEDDLEQKQIDLIKFSDLLNDQKLKKKSLKKRRKFVESNNVVKMMSESMQIDVVKHKEILKAIKKKYPSSFLEMSNNIRQTLSFQ